MVPFRQRGSNWRLTSKNSEEFVEDADVGVRFFFPLLLLLLRVFLFVVPLLLLHDVPGGG